MMIYIYHMVLWYFVFVCLVSFSRYSFNWILCELVPKLYFVSFVVFRFATMGTRVYVGRLSYHVRERDLERFFKGYGRIREIMLKNGYGFVVSLWRTAMALGYCIVQFRWTRQIKQINLFLALLDCVSRANAVARASVRRPSVHKTRFLRNLQAN